MENNALSPRVPPGFRFHPTDEELVDYYLRKKVESKSIDLDVIRDVDLYRLEPWDLQEQCRIGHEEQTDWYFFSHKDKKYPTGTRTNRATVAGFWKATGRDKAIYVKLKLIGMRKTLVFYKGRAPNGQKTDWIMHEYRLETNENAPPQEEGWVVCRAFRKRASHVQHVHAHALKRSSLLLLESTSNYYHDHRNTTTAFPFSSNNHDHEHGVRGYIDTGTGNAASLQPSLPEMLSRNPHYEYQRAYACKQEEEEEAAVDLESLENLDYPSYNASFMQLPQLESPKLPSSSSSNNNSTTATTNTNNSSSCGSSTAVTNALTTTEQSMSSLLESISMGVLLPGTGTGTGTGTGEAQAQHMTTDWKVLDRLVASQLMDSAAAAAAVHGQIPLHQYNNGGGTTNNSTSLFSSPFPLSLSTESFMSTLLVRQSNKATAESPDCEASSSVCDVHHDDDYIWSAFAP